MIRGFILNLQFLTRLPINIAIDYNRDNLRRSTFFFPFTGMLIGLMAYLVNYAFSFLGEAVAAAFTVLALVVITGGLHLDGLSDTCDGFFSNKDRETMMEIMKDSRVGAFGVISLIMILLLKYALIQSIPRDYLAYVLAFSLGNSRLTQIYTLSFKEPARKHGTGYIYTESEPRNFVLLGILVYIVVLALVDRRFLLPLAVNFLSAEYVFRQAQKKIGGFTGDILGTIAETGEVVSMLAYIGVLLWI